MGAAAGLIVALLVVALNAVFVATEFALVAVDRAQIELRVERGERRATMLAQIVRRLSHNLSGVQLGVTFFSVILGFLAEPAVATLLRGPLESLVGGSRVDSVALVIALVLVTVVQMVAGELIPKAIAVGKPMSVALAVAPIVRVYGLVLGPFIGLFNGAANGVLRVFGIEAKEELSAVRSRHELQRLVTESGEEGALEPEEARLLSRAFRFADKCAGEILTPRTDLVALPATASAADLVERSVETGFSRFPVFGTDLDDIVGVCHVKAVLDVSDDARGATPVSALAADAVVVPESKPLPELMVEMRGTGSYLVVVADEYGGTAGIVTLEDVLEEIVGEIDDEHDLSPSAPQRVKRWGLTWVLDGGLHLDEVADEAGLELPDGDYETLAGFVLSALGAIPIAGDRCTHDGWSIQVVEMDRHRIATVRLTAPSSRLIRQEEG